MKQKRLSIYQIDMKYVRDLAKVDDNVMSVSPKTEKICDCLCGVDNFGFVVYNIREVSVYLTTVT